MRGESGCARLAIGATVSPPTHGFQRYRIHHPETGLAIALRHDQPRWRSSGDNCIDTIDGGLAKSATGTGVLVEAVNVASAISRTFMQ